MTPGQRLRRLLTGLLLVAAVGTGYALWVNLTHLSIPCPFHAITGLQCPGCGVTRMCLALLRLDVSGAWKANPVLLLLLPLLGGAAGLSCRGVCPPGQRPHRPLGDPGVERHGRGASALGRMAKYRVKGCNRHPEGACCSLFARNVH